MHARPVRALGLCWGLSRKCTPVYVSYVLVSNTYQAWLPGTHTLWECIRIMIIVIKLWKACQSCGNTWALVGSVTQVYTCVCQAQFWLATHTWPACQVPTLCEHILKSLIFIKKTLVCMPDLWEHLNSGWVCHIGVWLCMSGALVSHTHQA